MPSIWLRDPLAALDDGGLSQSRADRITWGFVILGIAACTVRFGLRFPLWHDESFLAINFARRDFAGILEPLEYHQVAPPLFLLAQMLLVRIAGFTEWTLRFIPFGCTVASFLLFRRLARHILERRAFVFAVAFFSVSYWLIRYSAEAKPYAVDVLIALLLLGLFIRWRDQPDRPLAWRLLIALCGLSLVAFGLSFPSVIIGGGVCVSMAMATFARRSKTPLLSAAIVGAALCVGLITVYWLHLSQRNPTEHVFMRDYWEAAFPPFQTPTKLAPWFFATLTGEMMPYPIGGKDAGSIFTFILVITGIVALVRARRFEFLAFLLAPIALAFVAAAMKRYPFGAPSRCQLYLAPTFCLMAGIGSAALINRLGPSARQKISTYFLIALAVIGASTIVRDVLHPAKTTTDTMFRDFARLFWGAGHLAGEQNLCLREDFGVSFTPNIDASHSLLANYLCNYYIYAPPRAANPINASAPTTVRVANYRANASFSPKLRRDWIRKFEAEHNLNYQGSVLFHIPDVDRHNRIRQVDVIETMTFTPRQPPPSTPR